jgi:drug/metabolite transporter (DMT)-like permease
MVVAIALAASLCYAVAVVLQQRTARGAAPDAALRPRLLAQLAHRPVWLAGIAANVAGYGLRFVALSRGSLVLVQPLLVCGILFALPLAAAGSGRRLDRREWASAAAIVAGLGAFLVAAGPTRGSADASTRDWAALAGVSGLAVAVALVASRRVGPARAVAVLAGSAGVLFAVAAALTKLTAGVLARGLTEAAASPAPYGMVVAGVAGMVVVQTAFQAGPLAASLPMLTVVEPLASIGIGRLLLGEHVSPTAGGVAVEVAGLALMTLGVFAATTSPLLGAAG